MAGRDVPYHPVRTKEGEIGTERLEVRLDEERRRKLAEVASRRGTPVSEAVRTMIDEAYEDLVRERRLEAARRIASMEIAGLADPDELSRELESAHEPTGLS
jgi:uncharacterized protein (DUF1778 family)